MWPTDQFEFETPDLHAQNADTHIPIYSGALLVKVPLTDWC